jgi:hypothetical protein
MDAQTVRAVAFELLHAHEAMSPMALAEAAGTEVRMVFGALSADDRFSRVAGEGCWWWRLSPLSHIPAMPGSRRRALAADAATLAEDGAAHVRAYRQRVAVRERIRGALQANPGGATLARLIEATGLAGAEIADQLQGLRALGEVHSFILPGIAGFEFWKESAA